MDKSVNEQLLSLQIDWNKKCYTPLLEEYQQNTMGKEMLSCAFSFGVSEHYINSKQKIMIVGQEANGHTFDYEEWGLASWQAWAIDYLNFQVYKENPNKRDFSKNTSSFWQFITKFANKKDCGVCWNNIDKVRRYIKVDEKNWKESYLPYEKPDNSERNRLNQKIFDNQSKSLLQKEIELVEPNIVIFTIGPSNPYFQTLYSILLREACPYSKIRSMPCPKVGEECVRIDKYIGESKLPICYYTYHPNYLQKSGNMKKVIEQIMGKYD